MTPEIRELVRRVRARWRRLTAFRAAVRASLAAAGVLVLALALSVWIGQTTLSLAALGVTALALMVAALFWGVWPARHSPSDARIARFIEEQDPSLDDRLVSAVDLASSGRAGESPDLAEHMLADAGRRAAGVDPAAIVPDPLLRRAGVGALAALLLLALVAYTGRDAARRSVDALALTFFPGRVTLEVTPGDVRVPAGSPLTIEARLVGNRAPVVAQVLTTGVTGVSEGRDDEDWRATEMASPSDGTFTLALGAVATPFRYRVVAGLTVSPTYEVLVARAPRVTRIDVEYTYPRALGLERRVEEDGGDLYAPAGTEVRLRVHTDADAAAGRMTLGPGRTVDLTREVPRVLTGALTVVEDGSYRLAVADRDGLTSAGDTEYFIRILEDRPPEVRLLRPARDRSVTALEEVDIEAEAEDDYGIDRFELVYAVGGGPEKAVPLGDARRAVSVKGAHTLYLEDLNVRPGDFLSYYVRARDVARGRRAIEVRSDIFFLEVKPFEQEFTLAQSQAMGGGGGNRSLDDLVSAQKEIIVATWTLDRRAQTASAAGSAEDIRAVAGAESELKTRVEQTASAFRESTMRDPRRRLAPGRGAEPPPPDGLRAGQTLPEEDAMTAAVAALGQAVSSLNDLKTRAALPSEMQALTHLLKAQADVRERQISRQQAAGGPGSNRTSQDLSNLFDRELQRDQETNYETPATADKRGDAADNSLLDKVRELARRQDELLRRQQELQQQREQLTPEEIKRALESLTRDQTELRQRAEEVAGQLAEPQRQGRQTPQGAKPSQQSQAGQQGQSGQQGSSGQSQAGRQMREASDAMRSAAGDLRREDPGQASASGNRALEQLREVARQLEAAQPDQRRRALGDMQLEARQLADAQRQVASELDKLGAGEAGRDALRRLGGEEERLAERVNQLQQGLARQAATPDASGDRRDAEGRAASDAAREMDRQRLAERMQESAGGMWKASAAPDSAGQPGAEPWREVPLGEIARALDRLADQLAVATGPGDEQSRRLGDQRARAREIRDRIDSLTRELERLGQEADQRGTPSAGGGPSRDGEPNPGGGTSEAARLREEYNRQLQQARELLDELRSRDASRAPEGSGFTFEGQGMVLSEPGTEGFKQDFAKWDELRRQATLALEQAESALSKQLEAAESRERLAAGVDDKPPPGYQQQVDSYFKALAGRKP